MPRQPATDPAGRRIPDLDVLNRHDARYAPEGGRLGLYGFGASAHLTAQVALARGAEVHVLTRGAGARRLATELGAASVGHATDPPPVPRLAALG